jgi:hypothetical protein
MSRLIAQLFVCVAAVPVALAATLVANLVTLL